MNKKLLYLGITLIALCSLIYVFSNIFIYLSLSIVLASILRPLTNYINQAQLFYIRVPRILAVFFSFVVLVLVLSFFILLFVPLVAEQIDVLSNINYDTLFETLVGPFENMENFLIAHNITNEENGFIVDNIKDSMVSLLTGLDVTSLLNNILSFTGSFFVGLLAVTFITFVLLYEKDILQKKLIALIPNQYFEISIGAVYKIEKLFSNYLLGLLFQMLSIFSIAALGLTFMGINYAPTIALFAALANLIPYAGPLLGATFGMFVGISTTSDLVETNEFVLLLIKIGSVFAVVQLIDNMILQPLIYSKSVKAHPLEIFVVIFAGATLAQIPGMIAAIPVYTVLRVSFKELYRAYKQYHIFQN